MTHCFSFLGGVVVGAGLAMSPAWWLVGSGAADPPGGMAPRAMTAPTVDAAAVRPPGTPCFAPHWGDLESSDYPTYVRNLRAFGCPEPTLRDIVIADLHAVFDAQAAGRDPTGDGARRRDDERSVLRQLLGDGVRCERCDASEAAAHLRSLAGEGPPPDTD